MSNAVTRTHSGDRFYNPPAVRHQQQLLLQQQKLHLQRTAAPEKEDDELPPPPVPEGPACAPPPADLTNLDRLMDSITPFVPAHYSSPEVRRKKGTRSCSEADNVQAFYRLGDLWECFEEWSVYGVGVPLLLNGSDIVKQYYVPSLSGIQLYVDPVRLRRHVDDADAESLRETSNGGSNDCEAEKRERGSVVGKWGQLCNKNLSSHRVSKLRDEYPKSPSSEENEVGNSPGVLVFQYLEEEQPHHRKPLYDKVSNLATQFPDIKSYWSCDLTPSSWVSVAWYPIYRIPVGPTLQNLDASFLTFHPLSTLTKSQYQDRFDLLGGRKMNGLVGPSKIPIPAFGLASYKLRGSILTPKGVRESQQASSLLEAAGNWLRILEAAISQLVAARRWQRNCMWHQQ